MRGLGFGIQLGCYTLVLESNMSPRFPTRIEVTACVCVCACVDESYVSSEE